MTAANPPLYLQNDGPSAIQHRNHMTSAFGDRGGILGPDDLLVSEKSGTANMSIDIAAGRVAVLGDESTYQGVYLCHNQGVTNVVVAASDVTNDRYDIVYARVQDATESGATDAWSLSIVTGTPAASPVVPSASLPANSHVLALILVPSSAGSIVDADITDYRTIDTYGTNDNGTAVQANGVISCLSTDRPLVSLYTGMKIYETDTGNKQTWNGSIWIPDTAYFKYTRTSNQTSTTGTETLISYSTIDTETEASSGVWALSPNPTRIVMPYPGVWAFEAQIPWDANSAGYRSLGWKVNGTIVTRSRMLPVSGVVTYQHGSFTYRTTGTTDYIEVEGWQDSGVDRTITYGAIEIYVSATYLGAA